jgi:hypothetical protein
MHTKAELNELGFSRFLLFKKLTCALTGDKVHNERDNREQEQQMDQQSCPLENQKASNP